jgi:hypothetical protein
MTVRVMPLVGCVAIAVGVSAAGCHDFELVGILASDAGGSLARLDAADARAANAADAGQAVVVTIDDCRVGGASNLDAMTIDALLAGGESTVKWLYPYDGTVFPGGLTAPLLMWDDGGATEDAVYVHLHSSSLDYRGCTKPTAPGQVQFPQQPWAIAGASATGATNPFSLEITVLAGGRVFGPAKEQIVIATGSLPGSVYYMTLGSKMGIGPGSILRVPPSQGARLVFGATGCFGCHSISANGSTLMAYANGMGTAFALQPSSGSGAPVVRGPAPGAEAPGMTPDGSLYVASAHPAGVGLRSYGAGVLNAGLYETATGNLIASSGIPTGAMAPAFSPDGSLLVFNDFAIDSGKGLALMNFSASARTASNYRTLFSDSANYPIWPSFLPDGQAVVFQLSAGSDFTGGGTGLSGSVSAGPRSDLFLVDVTSHTSTLLARAMGFTSAANAASELTYLPFGSSEAHQNYDPTVFPVASGGYAWVFFDSMRHYGNVGLLRQIWGAAIDVNPDGTYALDPSHPAFFLPGQEIGTGNFRPIAALEP